MEKIIHIASDEKFINSAYWQFNEIFPEQNTFYLLVNSPSDKLKYVELNKDFILFKNGIREIKSLARSFLSNQIIIFHGLDYYSGLLLNNLSDDCMTIWMFWGWEVYNNPYIKKRGKVYGDSTFPTFILQSRGTKFIHFVRDNASRLYRKIKNGTDTPNRLILKAIKRVDCCGTICEEEYDFVKKRINKNIRYLEFFYYPIELMVKDKEARVRASNILMGNSASPTNNHLETFELLKELPVRERKVIVPLSYGDSKYAAGISKIGKEMLSDNFIPLIDFIPLREYNEYLEQCGIVIMNHYRQQAVGNVLAMLWMGAKVYLDERNTLYHYLKRIGIYVFSIQRELRQDNPYVFALLEKEFQDANRRVLEEKISQEILLERLRMQLKTIIG